jgi:hypothetical protein
MFLYGRLDMGNNIKLPLKIYLEDYAGNYGKYIDAVYAIFEKDFIKSKAKFGSHPLGMKFNPLFQERAYTFYHMTHEGEDEGNRIPDIRRCECLPWARPAVENAQKWGLKFWRQSRSHSKNRVCIWLESSEDVEDDYFIILEVRETYVLLWTAFMAIYSNTTRKKQEEYEKWKNSEGKNINTPDELIELIQSDIKKQGADKSPLP